MSKRPLASLGAVFALGIFFGKAADFNFFLFLGASLVFLAAAFFAVNRRFFSVLALSSVLLLGASFYAQSRILPSGHIINIIKGGKRDAVIEGVIVTDVTQRMSSYGEKKTDFTLRVNSVKLKSVIKTSGLVSVSVYSKNPVKLEYADRIILQGILKRPRQKSTPGTFDYRAYLESRDIYVLMTCDENDYIEVLSKGGLSKLKTAAYRLRHKLRSVYEKTLSASSSALASRIMLGNIERVPHHIRDYFVKTGTVHILAISGLHVGIIALMLYFVFRLLVIPLRLRSAMLVAALVFYALVTGSNPPVVRAVIMASFIALGFILNRESDVYNSLSAAALAMLLYNPKLLFNAGFQLSFTAVISIICLSPGIDALLNVKNIRRDTFLRKCLYYILRSFSVSLAAWLGVLPITAFYFNIVTPAAVIVNIIFIPLLFFAVAWGFLLGAWGLLFSWGGAYIAIPLEAVFAFITNAARIFSVLRISFFRVPSPHIFVIIIYYAFFFLALNAGRLRLRPARLLIAAALVIDAFLLAKIFEKPRDNLSVTFIDVGRGDCILLEFPGGGTMLVDAGEGGDYFDNDYNAARSVVAPFLWNKGITALDAIVSTHAHNDHMGGMLYIIDNFCIGKSFDNSLEDEFGLYRRYKEALKEKGIKRLTVRSGDTIRGFKDTDIFVINPGKDIDDSSLNDGSIVLKIEHGDFGCLLSADIEEEGMKSVMGHGLLLRSDTVKVPHHGGAVDFNVGDLFYKSIGAEHAFITKGYYELSSYSMKLLNAQDFKVYDVSKSGTTLVISDGEKYEIIPLIKPKS